jgi:hypothetical protein
MASTGPNLVTASLDRQPIDYTLIHGAGIPGPNRRSVSLAQARLRRMWFGALEPQSCGNLLGQPERNS